MEKWGKNDLKEEQTIWKGNPKVSMEILWLVE